MIALLCVAMVFFGQTVRPAVLYTLLFFTVLFSWPVGAPVAGAVAFLLWIGVELGIKRFGGLYGVCTQPGGKVYGQVGGFAFAVVKVA